MKTWIGIDVSKATLDVVCREEGGAFRHLVFPNSQKGFGPLLSFAKGKASISDLHFCLEATGAYGTAVTLFLVEHEAKVSVVNPSRVRYFGLSKGPSNKTDKADARLLCDFCQKEQPPAVVVASEEQRTLVALLRRLHTVSEDLRAEHNRLKEPGLLDVVKQSLLTMTGHLEKEEARLEREIQDHINTHPKLKEDQKLLLSIPGIGIKTSWQLMAELPEVHRFQNAQQVAAYAGLNPRECRSGTSVHAKTRIAKTGNAHLRKALYWPAITASRHNPTVKAFCQRLTDKGKQKMVVVAAAMRKLLLIVYGVLKHRTPFSYYQPTLQPHLNPA